MNSDSPRDGAPAPNLHIQAFDVVQVWLQTVHDKCEPCFECCAKLHKAVREALEGVGAPAPVPAAEQEQRYRKVIADLLAAWDAEDENGNTPPEAFSAFDEAIVAARAALAAALPHAPSQHVNPGYVSDEGDETEDDFPHHSAVDTAGVSRLAVHAAERVSTAVAAHAPSQQEDELRRLCEAGCRFNCDAESSCDCHVHRLYRAAAHAPSPPTEWQPEKDEK